MLSAEPLSEDGSGDGSGDGPADGPVASYSYYGGGSGSGSGGAGSGSGSGGGGSGEDDSTDPPAGAVDLLRQAISQAEAAVQQAQDLLRTHGDAALDEAFRDVGNRLADALNALASHLGGVAAREPALTGVDEPAHSAAAEMNDLRGLFDAGIPDIRGVTFGTPEGTWQVFKPPGSPWRVTYDGPNISFSGTEEGRFGLNVKKAWNELQGDQYDIGSYSVQVDNWSDGLDPVLLNGSFDRGNRATGEREYGGIRFDVTPDANGAALIGADLQLGNRTLYGGYDFTGHVVNGELDHIRVGAWHTNDEVGVGGVVDYSRDGEQVIADGGYVRRIADGQGEVWAGIHFDGMDDAAAAGLNLIGPNYIVSSYLSRSESRGTAVGTKWIIRRAPSEYEHGAMASANGQPVDLGQSVTEQSINTGSAIFGRLDAALSGEEGTSPTVAAEIGMTLDRLRQMEITLGGGVETEFDDSATAFFYIEIMD